MFDPLLPRRRGPDFTPARPPRRVDPGLVILLALAGLGVVAFVLGFHR